MDEGMETRTVLAPRTGTKICALIAVAFIAVAAYLYFVPENSVRSTSGAVFGCGTAAHPTGGPFAEGVCWRITDVNRYRAIGATVIALLTLSVGAALFGVDRRTESRPARESAGRSPDDPTDWGDVRGQHADGRKGR